MLSSDVFACVALLIPFFWSLEPRGGNQDDFDDTLKGYYDSIRQGGKIRNGRKRKGKKLGLKNLKPTECSEKSKNGAAFLAVCRGKVCKLVISCNVVSIMHLNLNHFD